MLHNGTPFLIYSVGSTQILQVLAGGWPRQVRVGVGGHNRGQHVLPELAHHVPRRVVVRHHEQFARFGDGLAHAKVPARPPNHLGKVARVDVGVQQVRLLEVVVPPVGAVPVRGHLLPCGV